MRIIFFIAFAFGFNCICGCNNPIGNIMSIQIRDTFLLPGIPSAKTIHFNGSNIYYQSMDEPGKETFKSFSLHHNKLVWSKNISQIGINEGAIITTGEYVVPTLSDSVFLISENGDERILNLEYRCKINPLVYKNTFILQDRGVGLKCFDAESLQQLWFIKQQSSFTVSQPLLLDSSIVYILDDNKIQSSNAVNGKLNWRMPVRDSFALYDLYGNNKDFIFILSTNLENEKQLIAISYRDGNLHWQVMVDSTVNEFDRDMIISGNSIFCRGDSSIFVYSIQDGRFLKKYNYRSKISTNLVADKNGNVLFGLEDNRLIKIDYNGNQLVAATFKSKLYRLYRFNDALFLYSYPNLYSLEIDP